MSDAPTVYEAETTVPGSEVEQLRAEVQRLRGHLADVEDQIWFATIRVVDGNPADGRTREGKAWTRSAWAVLKQFHSAYKAAELDPQAVNHAD